MSKIYLGRLEIPEELAAALGSAGLELIHDDPPDSPETGDLALVPARDGITSTLRHEILNAMTTVLGFTELLQRRMDMPEGADPKLERILEYGNRVKNLVRRHENTRD